MSSKLPLRLPLALTCMRIALQALAQMPANAPRHTRPPMLRRRLSDTSWPAGLDRAHPHRMPRSWSPSIRSHQLRLPAFQIWQTRTKVVSVSTSWLFLLSEALVRPPLPHWCIGVLVGHPSTACLPKIPFPPLSFSLSSPPCSSMQAHETNAFPSSSSQRHLRPTSPLNRRTPHQYRQPLRHPSHRLSAATYGLLTAIPPTEG